MSVDVTVLGGEAVRVAVTVHRPFGQAQLK